MIRIHMHNLKYPMQLTPRSRQPFKIPKHFPNHTESLAPIEYTPDLPRHFDADGDGHGGKECNETAENGMAFCEGEDPFQEGFTAGGDAFEEAWTWAGAGGVVGC